MHSKARARRAAKGLILFISIFVAFAARAEEDVKDDNQREEYSTQSDENASQLKATRRDSERHWAWDADGGCADNEKTR